jgi:ABC-type multidrug transport system ATPase subunit
MDVLAVEARGVRKSYGTNEVLLGLDLLVPRGQVVGFIGLNGAGKSTTLAILLGLLRADAGEMRVLGARPDRVAFLGGRVGVALHRPGLEADLTVRQNLRLHALRYGKGSARPNDVLERLDLARLGGRRVAKLSQGERQRLALARALLLEPELLILDEPLTHLDPGAVHGVLDVLVMQRARGATVLLSSHQLDHVERIADRIALLHRGRLVLEGTVPELLAGKSGKPTYLVALRGERAPPPFEGIALVAAHAEVEVVERERLAPGLDPRRDTLFRVQLAEDAPERLNAALVSKGFGVALLRPERASLDELFKRITATEAAA